MDVPTELRARLDAYRDTYATPLLEHGDPAPALSPAALTDADALWEFSQSAHDDQLVPPAVGQALGLVRQIRARHLPAPENLHEMAAALGLFSLATYGLPVNAVSADFRWIVDDTEAMAMQARHIVRHADISGLPMLDRAIELYGRALTAGGPAHPDRPVWLANHSYVRQLRYRRRADPADLDVAVRAAQEALVTWLPDEPGIALCHTNLEQSAGLRYERHCDPADLDLAVTAARSAAAATGEAAFEAPPMAARIDHLAHHLAIRADLTGSTGDLDEAVAAARSALTMTDVDDPARPRRLAGLARRLHSRYLASHADADLDAATRYSRDAVTTSDQHGPHHASVLTAASEISVTRHHRAWSMDDVEAAVRVGRAAVDSAPPGHRDRAAALAALAAALRCRHGVLGDVASLDEAVSVIRESIESTEHGRDLADRTDLLVHILYARALSGRTDTAHTDADEAVRLAERLVDDQPRRPELLHRLATVLRVRATVGAGDPAADRAAAMATERRALAEAGPGHPLRGHCALLVAILSFDEFRATGEGRHLKAALAAARESALDDGLLATLLAANHRRSGRTSDAEEAIGLWRAIAARSDGPVASRMTAARSWADVAASLGRWPDALEGYALAVELLPLLAWRGLDVRGRERLLADWSGLAQDAAAAALCLGDVDRAIALLEHGRSVLWTQVLAGRTELGSLRSIAPGPADRLADVRAELDRYAAPTDPLADMSRYGSPGDRRMILARQFDALLAQARALPGMAALLRAPELSRSYQAVGGGALVMVNVSRLRCDAIVVTRRGPRVVPLPRLRHDDVAERVRRHLAATRALDPGPEGDPDRLDAVIAREQGLTETLEWLWNTVAEPVLTALGCAAPPAGVRGPRVWWCPTGLLGLLPLHAAGRHDGGPSVLDLVVSSYASSLRTLAAARAEPSRPVCGVLLVAAPDVPDRPVLGHVADEIAALTALLPGGHTLMSGSVGRAAVLAELDAHQCVHFSGHGHQNLVDPGAGGVALSDGTLTVTDLMVAGARGGELAFLSACDTAVGGVHVPDESITLAAALHHVGYRRVVGTLWPTPDRAAARLVGDVYSRLTLAGALRPEGAADALHDTVRAMRDSAPATPGVWAAFVHVGA